MNTLELAISERNRLVRFSIFTSVFGFALAVSARDPFLNIDIPFPGSDTGNITAGHVVVLGQPALWLLYLLLCSQILRYSQFLSKVDLLDYQRLHIDWRPVSDLDCSTSQRYIHNLGEFFRWFAVLFLPILATTILYKSQFDFYSFGDPGLKDSMMILDDPTICDCNWKQMDLLTILRNDFDTIKPSYLELTRDQCSYFKKSNTPLSNATVAVSESQTKTICEERETQRQEILVRMPRLYQPLNFLISTAFQVPVVLLCIFLTYRFFA